MIILAVILMLALCIFTVRRKTEKQKKCEPVLTQTIYFNTLLQNIETYDGTHKGQKRLEDSL